MDYPNMQEVFDAMAYLPASHLAMYADVDAVALKHLDTIKTEGLTAAYFDDMAAVAKKYDLHYANPKYKVGLKPVETRPTVH